MAIALTYQSGSRANDLRTVLVDDVRTSVVLLPAGRLDIVQAKLLCGTTSRCDFWAQELGLQEAHDFAVPANKIRAQHEMQIGARVKTDK
jgi:hypothetical protein